MARYMILILSDVKAWAEVPEDEQGAIMGDYYAYTQSLVEAGVMLGGDPLQGPDTAKTVGKTSVTDGPFSETTEGLGGYYVLDTATIEEACEWAAKLPGVTRGIDKAEVRPIQELDVPMPG